MGSHKSKGLPRKKQDQAAYIARLEMKNPLLQNRSLLPSDLLSSREIYGAGNEHIFEVSCSRYYAWIKRMDQADRDGEKMDWIRLVYQENRRI